MNISPIPALANFVAKASVILPATFSGVAQKLTFATYDEMSDISHWMQKERYLNFTGILLPVPPGFNGNILAHINKLETVWGTLQNIRDGVLSPVDKQLATFTHELGVLTLPVGFKFKNFKYPLKSIKPSDLVAKLATSYDNTVIDQRPIEVLFASATEIDTTFTRAKLLNKEVTKRLQADVSKLVASISGSVNVLSTAPLHPSCTAEITLMVEMASEWVELLGLFMKQLNELIDSMNNIGGKLKQLKETKK